jgi:hypothetical protein
VILLFQLLHYKLVTSPSVPSLPTIKVGVDVVFAVMLPETLIPIADVLNFGLFV